MKRCFGLGKDNPDLWHPKKEDKFETIFVETCTSMISIVEAKQPIQEIPDYERIFRLKCNKNQPRGRECFQIFSNNPKRPVKDSARSYREAKIIADKITYEFGSATIYATYSNRRVLIRKYRLEWNSKNKILEKEGWH